MHVITIECAGLGTLYTIFMCMLEIKGTYNDIIKPQLPTL